MECYLGFPNLPNCLLFPDPPYPNLDLHRFKIELIRTTQGHFSLANSIYHDLLESSLYLFYFSLFSFAYQVPFPLNRFPCFLCRASHLPCSHLPYLACPTYSNPKAHCPACRPLNLVHHLHHLLRNQIFHHQFFSLLVFSLLNLHQNPLTFQNRYSLLPPGLHSLVAPLVPYLTHNFLNLQAIPHFQFGC